MIYRKRHRWYYENEFGKTTWFRSLEEAETAEAADMPDDEWFEEDLEDDRILEE